MFPSFLRWQWQSPPGNVPWPWCDVGLLKTNHFIYVLLNISSAWNLKTLEINWRIHPHPCKMYDRLFLLSACVYLWPQRLFCHISKWEDSCCNQPLWQHWLVFPDLWSLHGCLLPTHHNLPNTRECHSSKYIRPWWQCCAIRNVVWMHLNHQFKGLEIGRKVSPWMYVTHFLNKLRLWLLWTAEDIVQALVHVYQIYTLFQLWFICVLLHLGLLLWWGPSPNHDWCIGERLRVGNSVLGQGEFLEKACETWAANGKEVSTGISEVAFSSNPHCSVCYDQLAYIIMQKLVLIASSIVLGLAILAAFWHWPLWGWGNPKLSFQSFESLTVHWGRWTSKEWNDDHWDAVLLLGQQLGLASEHGINTFQVTTKGSLCFADLIAPSDQSSIDL